MADSKSAAQLVKTIAPLPITKRSYGLHVSTSAKGNLGFPILAYGCGRDVIFRNLEDPSQSMVFTEHKAKVNVVKLSANGLWAASGDDEGKVLVWECGKETFGKVKNTVEVCSAVYDLDWAPDGKSIVAAGAGEANRAKVFSYDSGNTAGKIELHSKPILACSYKSARPFAICTASEDLNVNFYTGPPFKHVKSDTQHSRYPNCVRFAPGGENFISVGSDSRIAVYDGKTGEFLKAIENKDQGHKGSAIYSFVYSPDGKQILTASADKTARIWDIESGEVKATFTVAAKPQVSDMQVATFWQLVGDKHYLGTVSLSGAINYFDLAAPGQPTKIVQGVSAQAQALLLDQASGNFYVSMLDGQVARYEFKTGFAQWFAGKGHEKCVSGMAISGKSLVTVGYDDKLRISDTKSMEFSNDAVALGGQPVAVVSGKKDPSLIVVILTQGKLLLVQGGGIKTTQDLGFEPTSVDINNDDTEVAVGGKDKKIHLYKLAGGKFAAGAVLAESDKAIVKVAYRPKDNLLASVDGDKRLFFYADGKNMNSGGWPYHISGVACSAWSPSGARYATGSIDETVMIWADFTGYTEKRVTMSAVHSQGVDHVGFWDETSVITVGADRTIRIWNIAA